MRSLDDAMSDIFGPAITAALDALLCSTSIAFVVLGLARAWQSNGSGMYDDFTHLYVGNLTFRWVWTILVVAAWIYTFSRWFRYIGWSRLWALPFVLLILCLGAWVFAQRVRPGIDWLFLLLLQSPIMVLFILRVRSKALPAHAKGG